MAELQFQNSSFVSKKFITKTQTTQTIRLSVKNDVVNVLSVDVDSAINSYDCTVGEVSFYGKINVRFLYYDGTSAVGSGYNADFTSSVQSEQIDCNSRLVFNVTTLDVQTETNANTATITVLSEISVYAYTTQEVNYLSGGEGAYLLTETLPALTMADVVNLPLSVSEELQTTSTISTVLLAESSVCLSDYDWQEGVLTVNGNAVLRLTYLSDGNLVTDDLPFTFQREVDAGVILPNSQLYVYPTVRSVKVRLSIADDLPNTVFSADIAVNLRVESFKTEDFTAVTDAYGKYCDFVFHKKSVQTTLPRGVLTASDSVEFQLPAGVTPSAVVNAYAVATDCSFVGEQAVVSGYVTATLLSTQDGTVTSSPVEIPFTSRLEVDFPTDGCTAQVNATLCNVAMGSDAHGSKLTATYRLDVLASNTATYDLIVQAEEVPFDKSTQPAVEVCLAKKGETLWQLAKNLHMSQEELVAVNPEVTSPLERDARIVVFNKL